MIISGRFPVDGCINSTFPGAQIFLKKSLKKILFLFTCAFESYVYLKICVSWENEFMQFCCPLVLTEGMSESKNRPKIPTV